LVVSWDAEKLISIDHAPCFIKIEHPTLSPHSSYRVSRKLIGLLAAALWLEKHQPDRRIFLSFEPEDLLVVSMQGNRSYLWKIDAIPIFKSSKISHQGFESTLLTAQGWALSETAVIRDREIPSRRGT
jgi:hypothetical protein